MILSTLQEALEEGVSLPLWVFRDLKPVLLLNRSLPASLCRRGNCSARERMFTSWMPSLSGTLGDISTTAATLTSLCKMCLLTLMISGSPGLHFSHPPLCEQEASCAGTT